MKVGLAFPVFENFTIMLSFQSVRNANSTEQVVRGFYHPFLTQFNENSLLPLIIHHQLSSNYYSKQIICTFHNIHLLQEQHTMLLLEKEQQTTAISLLLPFSPLIIPYTWITLLCNCWVVNDYRISLWTPRQNVQSHALLLIFPCMLPCIYIYPRILHEQAIVLMNRTI